MDCIHSTHCLFPSQSLCIFFSQLMYSADRNGFCKGQVIVMEWSFPYVVINDTTLYPVRDQFICQISKMTIFMFYLQITDEQLNCLTLLLVSWVEHVSLHSSVVLRVAYFLEFTFQTGRVLSRVRRTEDSSANTHLPHFSCVDKLTLLFNGFHSHKIEEDLRFRCGRVVRARCLNENIIFRLENPPIFANVPIQNEQVRSPESHRHLLASRLSSVNVSGWDENYGRRKNKLTGKITGD